jgi:hypothetical protein
MGITAFPKIFAIGSPHIPHLFHDEVEVTEKVDGSQFVFGKIDGELQMRSKGAMLVAEAPQQMFVEGVNHVLSVQDRIPDNTVFYCEYLQKPKHNVLAYDRIPGNHLVLFGVSTPAGRFVNDHATLLGYAALVDIDCIPLLYYGKITDAEELSKLLDTESYLGGQKIEGVVVKNYKPFLLGGQIINVTSGKYVSEAFKEVHRKNWSKEHTSGGKWQTFCAQFNTPARWEKAIIHLKERGELDHEPRDIGKLIKEIQDDIIAEEKEAILKVLWQLHKDDVLRKAIAGFPQWYKERLMEDSFNDAVQNSSVL